MRQALVQMELMFLNFKHLDRKPYQEPVATFVTLHENAQATDTQTLVDLTNELSKRQHAEKLQQHVTRFEVEFQNVFREKRYWNLTPLDLVALQKSHAYTLLKHVAARRNFGTALYSEVFENVHGNMCVKLKLVFHWKGRLQGRTYTACVYPPRLE